MTIKTFLLVVMIVSIVACIAVVHFNLSHVGSLRLSSGVTGVMTNIGVLVLLERAQHKALDMIRAFMKRMMPLVILASVYMIGKALIFG